MRRKGHEFVVLLPAEGQDLLHQILSPQTSLDHLIQLIEGWVPWIKIQLGHLGKPQDGREDIVKVMGDTPG